MTSVLMEDEGATNSGRLARTVDQFDAALRELDAAKPFVKSRYQIEVYRLAAELLDTTAGVRALYELAERFEAAGVFAGGAWQDATALQPAFVGACLCGEGAASTVEAMSELRLLAAAVGRDAARGLDDRTARGFLREIVALNLEFLFPDGSEESRAKPVLTARARRLFAVIGAELSLDGLCAEVTEEILDLAAQRPIVTSRTRKLISLAANLPASVGAASDNDQLEPFLRAAHGPTPLGLERTEPAAYRDALARLSHDELRREAHAFAENLRETGLSHHLHPVLLRRLIKHAPELVGPSLGLNALGIAELEQNDTLAHQLIRVALLPGTAEAVYGFAGMLERGLLSRPEVAGGLRRLVELDIEPRAQRSLLALRPRNAGLTANAVLVSGALSVLGQPLGIGQGSSPTCQAARGISLWGLHAPGTLLEMVAHAARDGCVEMDFEGERLRSTEVSDEPIGEPDVLLDPVQIVLVPHLNRLYDEMMRRAGSRSADAHKWVNPAMYGRWVVSGFTSALDSSHTAVVDFGDFVRRFYATHHPSFNEGYELIYPNPVGVCVTDVRGRFLGPHAVSLQRVAEDPAGELRVYFFNPNNDGRQRWGADVAPSVRGFGEQPGESSLPFHQFASRLYAFHYNPYEEGDAYAVPDAVVEQVAISARESWGGAFDWRD